MNRILVTGLLLVLLLVPFAAAVAPADPGSAAGDNRPTMIVEYGTGMQAGLVKVTHIHYAKVVDKVKPAKPTTCYKLAGWKWTSPVWYQIDTASAPSLSGPVAAATGTWDAATSKTLFSTAGTTSGKTWDTYDGINLVTYGDYGTANVIAVTSTWYSRLGKTALESDILFDTDFTWGDATHDSSVMDLQNIATHEMGHTLGLSDLYSGSCSAVTMYGYSTEGDTGKRILDRPDITGLQLIYGL
jgi:hypothetical protein